jgi:hypothetical protein
VRTSVDPDAIAAEVRAALRSQGFGDAEVTAIRPGIEDTFMALMGAPEEIGA